MTVVNIDLTVDDMCSV